MHGQRRVNCLMGRTDDGWACQQCGWVYRGERSPLRNCPKSPDLQPAADRLGVSLADIARWASAVARWTLAGMPERTTDQIAACFALCESCEALRGDRCGECRCRVAVSGMAIRNKLVMKSEVCPLGKWT